MYNLNMGLRRTMDNTINCLIILVEEIHVKGNNVDCSFLQPMTAVLMGL